MIAHEPRGLALLAKILSEAVDAAAWIARTASNGARTAAVRVMVAHEESELSFALLDPSVGECGEVVDHVAYGDLSALAASPERMVAYADAVVRIVAAATPRTRLSEELPAPALLAIPELVTREDFERERQNVDLEERAVAQLRAAVAS